MKILYVVQGLGEFSQAESFAQYARTKKDENIFVTDEHVLLTAIKKSGFQAFRSVNTSQTHALIRKIHPDVVFLCNSKTVFMRPEAILKQAPPKPRPLIASFDSNWLFFNHKRSPFQTPIWLDLPFIVMPKRVYEEGLRTNGGHYRISSMFAKKIFTPGFIPSGFHVSTIEKQKARHHLKLKKSEKLIFSYFGIREPFILPRYIRALRTIIPRFQAAGHNIRVFIKLKKTQTIPPAPWLTSQSWVTSDDYVRYLASADLVIQHHGLGTLPKVMRNQVPALCIATVLKRKQYPYYEHSPALEIRAFERLDICRVIDYDFQTNDLQNAMEELLFNEKTIARMKQADQKYFEAGEVPAYRHLKDVLRNFQKTREKIKK